MAVKQLSITFTELNFRISLLNRDSEVAVNLKLVMFTHNSIPLEALYVSDILSLPKSFSLLLVLYLHSATNSPNPF